jgi:hypothetical protein
LVEAVAALFSSCAATPFPIDLAAYARPPYFMPDLRRPIVLFRGVVRSRCSVLDGIGWLAGLNVEAVVEEFVWLVLSNSDGRAAE